MLLLTVVTVPLVAAQWASMATLVGVASVVTRLAC